MSKATHGLRVDRKWAIDLRALEFRPLDEVISLFWFLSSLVYLVIFHSDGL